jgi:VanZ family protein
MANRLSDSPRFANFEMHDSSPPSNDRSPRESRFRRIASRARTLAIFYFLLLFAGTHIPSIGHSGPSFNDKWGHFGGYLVLTLCILAGWELTIGRLHARHYFAVWLAGVVYGAFDEWTQIPVGRTCDMNDWAADAIGVLCGIILYQIFRPMLFAIVGVSEEDLDKRD